MMTPPSTNGPALSSGSTVPQGGRNTYDSQQDAHDDVIGSLGNALAGVDLGGTYLPPYPKEDANNGAGGVDWGSSSLQSNNNSSGNGNPGTFSNGQRIPSRQNLLFGTDMNDLHDPATPVRKQSLELFLSQSPSQTLGEEVLQLQQSLQENKNAASQQGLNGWKDAVVRVPVAPIGAPASGQEDGFGARRRGDSPSTSIAGTSASSRSVSPSLFGNSSGERTPSTIHAFPGHGTMNRGGYGGPTLQNFAPGPADTQQMQMNALQMPAMDKQYIPPQAPVQQQMAAPQILYMAVPTPDGRGQMLQPVQVLQIPGGAQTFVLPQTAQMGAPTADANLQPMMVLPSVSQQPVAHTLDPSNKGTAQWSNTSQYSRNNEKINSQYGVDLGGGEDYSSNNRSSPITAAASDAIASIYSSPQRPPLDALLGHVRRLSRDQVGCRLLQQALDEEGSMAATTILNEGISFWGEAMVDPFGNYLFQKILEKITPEERIMLIKSVSSRLVNASLNLHGTRSVQKVVELCAQDEALSPETRDEAEGTSADILTSALSPAAARLCIDSHGNHVIQRILLKLGQQHSRFVFDAVAVSVGDVARHRHGCCVIQRCLDSPPSEPRSHLVHRIVENSLELMQDAYGNYVVQYVLDVCGDEDVYAVCESVVGKICLLAIQKFSSNVIEKCLERCSDRVKELYLQELSDADRIRELMMDPFGNYVVQRALSVATHSQAIALVEAMRPHLISSQPGTPHGQRNGGMRNTAGGRRIMAKICRRFPNFTLTAVGSPDELYGQHKGHHRKHQPNNMVYQSMSPVHQQAPPEYASPYQGSASPYQESASAYQGSASPYQGSASPYQGSPYQGQRVVQDNMRQPYFDVGGYYDQNGLPSYPPQM